MRSSTLICCVPLLLLLPCSAAAQAPDEIRRKVEKIGLAGKITVIFKNGDENYGTVSDIGTESFEVLEVDLKRKIVVRYDELRKVRANYGGRGFGGKRPNPLWGIITGVVLVGGLIAIMIASGGGA